jgi:hypothetical protein
VLIMPTPQPRPLLLLDVDGPLNPYAAKAQRRPPGYTTHRLLPGDWVARHAALGERAEPLRVWLNPDHGAALLALPYELVWATTWMHDANTLIAPRLGLPGLPVIEWPRMFHDDVDGIHWKTRHVVDWAAGRPFAWVDDEFGERDPGWVREHHAGPALLHHVDPRVGLTDRDFDVLKDWASHRM